jgi:hypothetical protein
MAANWTTTGNSAPSSRIKREAMIGTSPARHIWVRDPRIASTETVYMTAPTSDINAIFPLPSRGRPYMTGFLRLGQAKPKKP